MICMYVYVFSTVHGRFIQAFDFEGYQKWKSQGDDDTSPKEEIQQQQTDENNEKDTKEENDDEDKPPKFTFQELVEMIESGKEVPGRKDMDVFDMYIPY